MSPTPRKAVSVECPSASHSHKLPFGPLRSLSFNLSGHVSHHHARVIASLNPNRGNSRTLLPMPLAGVGRPAPPEADINDLSVRAVRSFRTATDIPPLWVHQKLPHLPPWGGGGPPTAHCQPEAIRSSRANKGQEEWVPRSLRLSIPHTFRSLWVPSIPLLGGGGVIKKGPCTRSSC